MKANNIKLLGDLIERLSEYTDTDFNEIVDTLVGVTWDEEEAGEIKFAYLD